jgi:hypothetical protein
MNRRFIKIKLLYPKKPEPKEKRIFTNSLSVNNINIKPIKTENRKNLTLINKSDARFASQRNIKIRPTLNQKIKLPKIQLNNKIKTDIKSKLIGIKNGNFFMTQEGKINLNKEKIKIPKNKKKRNNYKKYEDKKFQLNLDSLMAKFDAEYIIAALNKRNNERDRLNKLYGITSEYINKVEEAKNKKYLSLKNYQSNILDAYSFNEKNSEQSIRELSNKFNDLRQDIESIIPFPKINLKTMYNHIKNQEKKNKILSVKSYINKVNEPKDDYEREEELIKSLRLKSKNFSKLKFKSVSNF